MVNKSLLWSKRVFFIRIDIDWSILGFIDRCISKIFHGGNWLPQAIMAHQFNYPNPKIAIIRNSG